LFSQLVCIVRDVFQDGVGGDDEPGARVEGASAPNIFEDDTDVNSSKPITVQPKSTEAFLLINDGKESQMTSGI